MNKKITINPEKIKGSLMGFIRYLASKPFFSFFLLLLISLILGTLIFYKYGIMADSEIKASQQSIFKFESKTYRDILGEWEKRDQAFLGAAKKKYLDPFKLTNPQK